MRTCFAVVPFMIFAAMSQSAQGEDLGEAFSASRLLYENSLRFETVEHEGFTQDADALTWRNRIGFETGKWHGLSVLVELDSTTELSGHYNSTLNGRTSYPAIGDPEVTELNRAHLTWTPGAGKSFVLGRQRIVMDDGRFVGNAGWRQDEQTFDGLRFDVTSGKFTLTSAYITRVNRVQGDVKDWNSESGFVSVGYSFAPQFKAQLFSYDLSFTSDARAPTLTDMNNARAASVRITGTRLSGTRTAGDVTLSYGGHYAVETEGRGNPNDFRLEAYSVDMGVAYGWVTGRLSYESLGGDGTVGFVTPLSSPHPFQGYADAFSATAGLKTHVNGIADMRLSLGIAMPLRFKPNLTLIHHDFRTARLGQDLGTEWDAVASFAVTPNLNLMFKYADFEQGSPAGPASRTKQWVMVQYRR